MSIVDGIGLDLGSARDVPARAAAAAAAGARLARVLFPLDGSPFPDEAFLDTARAAVDAARAHNLRVLAVVDSDLTVAPDGAGTFVDRPSETMAAAWSDELAGNAARLADAVGDRVAAWEILPNPNAGDPAGIAPRRWAALLSAVSGAIRASASGAQLVTGALLSDERDDGVAHLRATFEAASAEGLWAPGHPPFDALGVRLAVLPDGGTTEEAVAAAVRERMRRLWRVLAGSEPGGDTGALPVYVTGIGWDATLCGADVQARNLWAALNALTTDRHVAAVVWSDLVDAPEAAIGLFESTRLADEDRRHAWTAFNDFTLYARQISPAEGIGALVAAAGAELAPNELLGELAGAATEPPAAAEEHAPEEGAFEVGPPAEQEPKTGGEPLTTPPPEPEPELEPAPEPEPEPEPESRVEHQIQTPDDGEPVQPDDGTAPDASAVIADEEEPPAIPEPWSPSVGSRAATGDDAPPDATEEATETLVFRIPDAKAVLREHGFEGERLAAALAALTTKYGGHEWLPPGEYRISLPAVGPSQPAAPQAFTNQDVISALYRAGGGTWTLLERSGLVLGELAARRNAPYAGPPLDNVPGLSDDERDAVLRELAGSGTS